MANISAQNSISYTLDKLSLRTTGVLFSASSSHINLSRASRVTGITVGGTQPPGTARYFAFFVTGSWGKLTPSGTFSPFEDSNASFANLETFGNTASELSALTNIPALAGKSFSFAIALAADDVSNAVPTASLTFKCATDSQQLVTSEYSPVYELGQDSQILSSSASIITNSGGTVSVFAQALKPDGTSTGWVELDKVKGVKAQNVQFRADYSAASPGASTAQLQEASLIVSRGKALVSGTLSREIISKTIDWYMPIHSCRLTIKHMPLTDSTISAYVAFRDQSTQIRGETLGVGTGSRKTFQLAHTNGIKYDTVKLYYDNVRVFTSWELNSEVGRITCSAPEGVIISCDYEYGWDREVWQSMRLSSRYNMDGYDVSEFRLATESNTKSAAAVKLVLNMTSGHINNEQLGTASGAAKSFKLSHIVNDGRITITANNATLSAKNWRVLDDPQYVSVAASAGQVIRASYDWVSESPKILQFSTVFAE